MTDGQDNTTRIGCSIQPFPDGFYFSMNEESEEAIWTGPFASEGEASQAFIDLITESLTSEVIKTLGL